MDIRFTKKLSVKRD